jgi:hypothetical protein
MRVNLGSCCGRSGVRDRRRDRRVHRSRGSRGSSNTSVHGCCFCGSARVEILFSGSMKRTSAAAMQAPAHRTCDCGRTFPAPSDLTKHQESSTTCVFSSAYREPAEKRRRTKRTRAVVADDDSVPLVVVAGSHCAAGGGDGDSDDGGGGHGGGADAAAAAAELPATQRAAALAFSADGSAGLSSRWMEAVETLEEYVEVSGSLRDGKRLHAQHATAVVGGIKHRGN